MAVFKFEIKKLLSSVSLWVLLLLFLVFNIYLVQTTNWNPYPDFVGQIAAVTGIELNESFSERLDNMIIASSDTEMLDYLKEDTANIEDHFDDYDVTEVGKLYVNEVPMPNEMAQKTQEKYENMQSVVDKKGKEDESLSLYHASATTQMHENLFETLFGGLLIEGIILTVVIALLSVGFESVNQTEDIVYSTSTGRNLMLTKFLASLAVSIGAYVLLTATSLIIYFSVHDYSAIWQSYVSNVFNYRHDIITGLRPFITWQSHTIGTYLLSKIGISLGLLICYVLLAFIIEMLIRNSYISFFILIITNALFVVLPMMFSNSMFSFYIMLSPVWLALKHSLWFTDGDVDIVWKNFEIVGTLSSTFLLLILTIIVFYRYKRRDIL